MISINNFKDKLKISGIDNYNISSNTLINFIFNKVDILTKKLEKEISPKTWETKKDMVLQKMYHIIGLKNFPINTSINAKIIGKIERNDYFIEKIILESFEGIYIPIHLYIPKKSNFPTPAILHIPGHWMENAKMEPDLQKCCIGLVKLGFIVLNMDPLEEGERRIGWRNHGHLETLLVGITQIGMMIYENIKAIDYLQTRKEVDGERIGMVGTSGGGSNTIYTMPFEKRIKVGIPICFANTFKGLLEGHRGYNWNGGVDLCNQVPQVIDTLTFSHLLALSAPRHILIISAKEDLNFPIKTAKNVVSEAELFFKLYGKDLIKHEIVSGGHGVGIEAREAAYSFFLKNLMNKEDGLPVIEPSIETEESPYKINYLDATADKNNAQNFFPEKSLITNVFDNKKLRNIEKPLKNMLIKTIEKKYKKFKIPNDLTEWESIKSKYKEKLNNLIVKTIDHSSLDPVIERSTELPGYYIERIIINSEDNIYVPCLLFLPDNWITSNNIWICLDDNGKRGFIENKLFEELIYNKQAILTIDLRGQGETLTVDFEVATMSYMIDRNLLFQRVFDLLRAVEYISQRATTGIQLNKQKIISYGKGTTALVTLFACAIDERISVLFTENQIISYKRLLECKTRFSPSIFIFDILSNYDIDDVLSLIFPRLNIILNPIDNHEKEISLNKIIDELNVTTNIYKKFNKKNRLIIEHSEKNIYSNLIKRIIKTV